MSAPQTINLTDGETAAVNITLNNPSNEENISGISVQAFIENPDKVYVDGDGYAVNNGSIGQNNSLSGTFYLRTEKDFTTKSVPIKLKLRYYVNQTFLEQEETIYVRVIAPEKPVNPSIEISKALCGPALYNLQSHLKFLSQLKTPEIRQLKILKFH